MADPVLTGTTIAVMLTVSAFYLLFPRIGRRGLLFGVYVGEDVASGERARRLAAGWTRAILAWTVLAFAAFAAASRRWGAVAGYAVGLLLLLLGAFLQYLRSYRAARALASDAPPAPAVAYLTPAPRPVPAYVALVFSLLAGAAALGYTALHRDALPARLPVHFDAAGRPDVWRPATPGAIWRLPALALVFGTTLAGAALLTAHAKRAVRRDAAGRSLAAQERFRAATSALLAGVALLVSGLLAATSVGAVRVATGAATTLPPVVPVLSVLLAGLAVAGTAFIGLRYGQGGSRLEEGAAEAPLTDGLADNRRWLLGILYFDPQDPSIFVEKRFGIGYTLNFGNWKAVLGLVVFLVAILLAPLLLR